MKLACAILLLLLPWTCMAKCKTTVVVPKVKIEASESDRQRLVKKLKEHGCNDGLGFELTDEGFDYRIAIANILKPRMTLTQAGIGSAEDAVVLTTVFDDKGTVLFDFGRGNRLTRNGVLNASAKEIVKRLIPIRSTPTGFRRGPSDNPSPSLKHRCAAAEWTTYCNMGRSVFFVVNSTERSVLEFSDANCIVQLPPVERNDNASLCCGTERVEADICMRGNCDDSRVLVAF